MYRLICQICFCLFSLLVNPVVADEAGLLNKARRITGYMPHLNAQDNDTPRWDSLASGAETDYEKGAIAKALALHCLVPLFDCADVLWDHGNPLKADDMIYPLHRAAEFGETRWLTYLMPGLKAKKVADNGQNPMFTLCSVEDSFQPYIEREIPSPHIKCGNELREAGVEVTLDNNRTIRKNGIIYKLYRYLAPEPLMRPEG